MLNQDTSENKAPYSPLNPDTINSYLVTKGYAPLTGYQDALEDIVSQVAAIIFVKVDLDDFIPEYASHEEKKAFDNKQNTKQREIIEQLMNFTTEKMKLLASVKNYTSEPPYTTLSRK